MEAHWRLYHLSLCRAGRGDKRRARAIEIARDYWPMPFALLIWVAVSELAWLGIFQAVMALF